MITKQRAAASLERTVSLVVIEAGATWPAFLTSEHLAADCDVLVQQPDESFVTFKRRVVSRIRKLASEGKSVSLGVLSTGPNVSEQALEGRHLIARALVLARATNRAELVLVAGEASPRDNLFALAETLCAGLVGADFGVRVRAGQSYSRRVAADRSRAA